MRILFGVGLHCSWSAAVRVAFSKDRVDCTAEDFCESLFQFNVGIGFGFVGIVRDLVALGLQFGDGGFELRD